MNWDNFIAPNVKEIKPSGIRKFFDIANQIEGVLSLSIGEPDFAAPEKIRQAMIDSINEKRQAIRAIRGFPS